MTLSQLLNHPKLPAEIRHEILAEMERQGTASMINTTLYTSLFEALESRDLFWFSFSIMGNDFWGSVIDNCKALGI